MNNAKTNLGTILGLSVILVPIQALLGQLIGVAAGRKTGYFPPTGEWRSLVAHLLWEQRVAGSNPVSPTNGRRRGPGAQ